MSTKEEVIKTLKKSFEITIQKDKDMRIDRTKADERLAEAISQIKDQNTHYHLAVKYAFQAHDDLRSPPIRKSK